MTGTTTHGPAAKITPGPSRKRSILYVAEATVAKGAATSPLAALMVTSTGRRSPSATSLKIA